MHIALIRLSIAYVDACIKEEIEEKTLKDKEMIKDLKISVFCYAVRHHLNYDDVVKMLQNKSLTFEDIEKDNDEYSNN